MHVNSKFVGAGVAVAIAAGLGYALLSGDDEIAFDTVDRDGSRSIRDYPELLVAETINEGLRESAVSRGFMALADYIYGKDRGGDRIAMTAPVFVDGDSDGRGWRTRFVMPEGRGIDELPPVAGDVRLQAIPGRRMAALRFSGEADDAALAAREAELRQWLDQAGHQPAGPVEYAFYNSPFMPGPLRRNEVLIPLAA